MLFIAANYLDVSEITKMMIAKHNFFWNVTVVAPASIDVVVELLLIIALVLFSLADLRHRVVPGIQVFFFGAVLLSVFSNPLGVAAIVLVVAWGSRSLYPHLIWPTLLNPVAWPVLLTGFGVRHGVIGKADLLAIGGIACIFPWQAVVLSILGVEVWRRWWVRHHNGPIPALPGMLLGLMLYLATKAFLLLGL